MSKAFTPTAARPGVITANDLREGHNVWMCDGDWTADPRRATVFEDQAIAELALLEALGQADRVIGPYLVEVKRGPDGPEPTHFREAFRQTGPSNYFHGIQAQKAETANV
ncbi:DUF2849 domain-containing protein [Paracoccus seriniphilus]|uniref:DUF2849 domain-containing protein n=1 Tax=Paracoccus seriniphilus TaxID=184748 RepID=A0A239Q1K0_9RHOB|nr:DUF2849 domain-containing protein [Paracoccus seriniphilus]WCR14516.1 DUF2849 domain-containing protein [Paracoccus seriniphilus]SNT76365.1 Protein of unknown function [Paracoccus seriniphilus]